MVDEKDKFKFGSTFSVSCRQTIHICFSQNKQSDNYYFIFLKIHILNFNGDGGEGRSLKTLDLNKYNLNVDIIFST